MLSCGREINMSILYLPFIFILSAPLILSVSQFIVSKKINSESSKYKKVCFLAKFSMLASILFLSSFILLFFGVLKTLDIFSLVFAVLYISSGISLFISSVVLFFIAFKSKNKSLTIHRFGLSVVVVMWFAFLYLLFHAISDY